MTALQLKELSQSGLYRRRRDRPDSVGLPGRATCSHVKLPGKDSCVNANRSIGGEEALPMPQCLFFGFIFRLFFIVDICASQWRSV
uniref:Uncharacterized protein n=1 Tax=Pavo cristatus TaxID=9049 RepID=A0A8C9LC37_PAVCR